MQNESPLVKSMASIYSYYIKYDRLAELIQLNYSGSKAEVVNIFVDLRDILKNIPYAGTNPDIIPVILNLCGHYRWFFSKLKVHTRIFVIFSDYNANYIYNQYVPQYNRPFIDISGDYDTINFLAKVIRYIPDIHFISTQYEFGVRVLDIIKVDMEKYGCVIPNLVLSKDVYNYQLVGYNIDIRILRPRKYNGEDLSSMINNVNVYQELFAERKCNYIDNILSPQLLPMIMVLNRVPERKLPRMYNLDNIIKILNGLIFDNSISNSKISSYDEFSDLFNKRLTNRRSKKLNANTLKDLIKVVDLEFQLNIYEMCKEVSIYNGIVNLTDNKSLNKVNEQFNYDIDLEKLLV